MVKNRYDTYHMPRRTRQVEGRELESCGDGDMAFGTCSKCLGFFFLRFVWGFFFFQLDFFLAFLPTHLPPLFQIGLAQTEYTALGDLRVSLLNRFFWVWVLSSSPRWGQTDYLQLLHQHRSAAYLVLASVGVTLEKPAILMWLKNQMYLCSVRLQLVIIQYFNIAVT